MRRVLNATKDAPYPYNLIRAIHGGDVPLEKLAPDIEQSVEYVLTNKMPEREARILQLKYRYGQKTREIAAQYCVTSQQISQMIHRGERMLRYPSRGGTDPQFFAAGSVSRAIVGNLGYA